MSFVSIELGKMGLFLGLLVVSSFGLVGEGFGGGGCLSNSFLERDSLVLSGGGGGTFSPWSYDLIFIKAAMIVFSSCKTRLVY